MSSEVRFVITAQAPLAINERKPGGSQYQEGLAYIPGRVLRGALANRVLRTCTDPYGRRDHVDCPNPTLCRALFDGQLRFSDIRPIGPASTTTDDRDTILARLLPSTAFSCKDEAGFRSDSEHHGHGVFDTLLERAVWELQGITSYQYLPRCPTCGGRTRVIAGAYTFKEEDGQVSYHQQRVAKELLTRVAINRRRGVAEDQLLYAISALSPHVRSGQDYVPARYGGVIRVPSASAEDKALMAILAKHLAQIHHIGSGRTRGLGSVKITVVETPTDTGVAARLQQFNARFGERWQVAAGLNRSDPTPPYAVFAVTLQSDAILPAADGWSPGQVLAPARLWAACGEDGTPPVDLHLLRAYASLATRGGWNALWGLRKESSAVVEAGAVYLFAVAALDDWAARLEWFETQGLGVRSAEGFGGVRVSDEFHLNGEGRAL